MQAMAIDNLTKEDITLSLIKKATEYQGTDSRGINGKKLLHQTNCKAKASDCKCHEINEQM
jgi:hypothetical protein